MSDWGKGVINNIGWGQGGTNDIGWGSIYDKSNAGETLLKSGLNIDAFIIEVDTSKAGTPSDQFQFTRAEGDYDVVAKQNDIVVATFDNLSGEQTITLPSSGIYVLEVTPKAINGFNRINFAQTGDRLKITDIKQWGTIVWTSFRTAYWNCNNMLITATDIPNLSNVNSMFFAFRDATIGNPNLRDWNVSNVTAMDRIFQDSNLSVENLTACYENWSQLNLQQNVSFSAGSTKYNASGQAGRDILVNTYNWTITDGGLVYQPFIIEVDTSKTGVSNADQFQFTGAEGDYDVIAKQNDTVVATFNNLSGAETITLPSSGVYNLEVKSKEVNGFNRIQFNSGGDRDKLTDIKQWGNIVWSSFSSAFYGCSNMLVTATDVPNLSNVNSMFAMFTDASSANPDTSLWDVSSVADMRYMFQSTSIANPDVSNWNVGSVTNMSGMFESATVANPDTTNWDVSSVTSMNSMFRSTSSANPDTTNWDVSSVNNMLAMFFRASSANPNVTNWDVSGVTNMRFMFYRAPSANPDTSSWDVSSVTKMGNMFRDSNLSVENLTACYENWSQLNLQQNVAFSAGSTKYNSSGQAGRDILVNTYNWTIEDGGLV